MMNSIKRLSVSVLASMMLMGTAHAKEVDLKKFEDKFNMMWNQTQASTNRVNGAYGGTLGGVSMRSPIRNWKMMSLTPPRFEAGCGGIDLHFGSFSFMSTDNIKDLMRTIISNSTGYAVELALRSICSDCTDVMKGFRDLSAGINFDNMNTCQMSEEAVNWIAGTGNYEGRSVKQRIEALEHAASNKSADVVESLKNVFSKKGNINANREFAAHNKDTSYGNNLLNTFISAGVFADNGINTEFYGGSQMFFEITMSLVGTNILKTGTRKDNEKDEYVDAIWTFNDLVKGTESIDKPLDMNVCAGDDFSKTNAGACQVVTRKANKWPGLERHVIELIAGKQGSGTISNAVYTITDDSIIAFLNDDKKVKLDATRKAYLNRMAPIYRQMLELLAKEYQDNPKTVKKAISMISQQFAKQYGAELAKGIHTTTKAAYHAANNKKKTAELSAKQEKALEKLQQSYEEVLKNVDKDAEETSRRLYTFFNLQKKLDSQSKQDSTTTHKQPS